jgi:hypothetical protein
MTPQTMAAPPSAKNPYDGVIENERIAEGQKVGDVAKMQRVSKAVNELMDAAT